MDHSGGQEHALGGQPGYGNLGRCAQTGGVQVQLTPHELRGQGGQDQEGVGATVQHSAVVGAK